MGSKQTPPVLRAPNGVVQDGREFWGAGKALYDPAEIRVPTFLAHAEWDADLPSYMLHAYFAKLTNAPYKRYVEIGEGTHTVIMEKNRMQLFQAVQQFLDERLKPEPVTAMECSLSISLFPCGRLRPGSATIRSSFSASDRVESNASVQPHRIHGTIDMANQNREINRTKRGNSKSSKSVRQIHRKA